MVNFSRFERRNNSINIRSVFNKNDAVETNCIYVTEEKYEELYLEQRKTKPFYDSTDRKFVKVQPKTFSIKLGINDPYGFSTSFIDKVLLTTRKMAGFENIEDIINYPFSFNYDNFFTMTNRLDVFSNVSKIQRNESYIDSLKGFKSNSLGNSNCAIGMNLKITDSFTKSDDVPSHYEDDIISSFLYHNKDKIIVDRILQNINPIGNLITHSVAYKKKNIITSEVRYFVRDKEKSSPFRDRSHKKNDETLNNKSNLYVFTNDDINNKILENRNINKAIKESNLYFSRGKDYDYSHCSGINSFLFNESID